MFSYIESRMLSNLTPYDGVFYAIEDACFMRVYFLPVRVFYESVYESTLNHPH